MSTVEGIYQHAGSGVGSQVGKQTFTEAGNTGEETQVGG